MKIRVAAFSSVGPSRAENQDVVAFTNFVSSGSMDNPISVRLDPTAGAVVVVDGMGGHAGGRTAAQIVGRRFADAAKDLNTEHRIRHHTHEAARDLHRAATLDGSLTAMGATYAGLSWTEETLTLFHVGDSRIYGLFGEVFRRLTTDDRVSYETNVLSKSVGGTRNLELVEPTVQQLQLSAPTRFVCCSDGLSDATPFSTIEQFARQGSPAQACFDLVRAAWPSADDNISVIVLDALADLETAVGVIQGSESKSERASRNPAVSNTPSEGRQADQQRRSVFRRREARRD